MVGTNQFYEAMKCYPFIVLLALASLAGCGTKAPPLETWPVQGTVIDQNGDSPTGGVIRLLTTNGDPHLITVGAIQPDGSFSVRTQRQGFDYEGAVAGEYQVAVMTAKTGPDGNPAPVRFDLPTPVVIKSASTLR